MSAAPLASYAFEPLDEGVLAAIARPDGVGVCNSGLVDLGGPPIVFDTSLTRQSARELWDGTVRTFGRPPALAANSHWHLDHSLGNQAFAAIPIWGTRRTREILLEKRDELMAELRISELDKEIRGLESQRAAMPSADAQRDLDLVLQINRALLQDAGNVSLTPPDLTFETRQRLPGTRGAELICFGKGHTEADAILHLPRERLVFAGDLVCIGVQPSMQSGDPEHWQTVLDDIEKLAPERVVPGHGPVIPLGRVQECRDYLSGVLAAAEGREQAPLPMSLRRWEGSVSLEGNLKFARQWLVDRRRQG